MNNPVDTPLYKTLLAAPEDVSARISVMAKDVAERYAGIEPLFVCLLRGGAPFAVELMREITVYNPHFHPELDYMTVSTYGGERSHSQSKLVMGLAPHTHVSGRTVVLLDDTLDKGVTADFARTQLLAQGAANIELVVLVDKAQSRTNTYFNEPTLAGFVFDKDMWLTGMGLDDARIAKEANRWAGYIAGAIDENN